MVTLRMVAVAVAILVGVPLLAAATHTPWHVIVQGGDVASANAEAYLEATNVTLVEAFAHYDRMMVNDLPEQLVEGHTVFLTIEIPLIPNITNWTVDINGDVSCALNESTRGVHGPFGIPIPTRIDRARLECQAAGEVFATPDPFYDSENAFRSSLQPTGNVYPFVAPNGQPSYTEEYTFFTVRDDEFGDAITRIYYAYAAPILDPWVAPNGETKSWVIALPDERLREMDVTEWTVVVDNDPRIASALKPS